jgi:hypothetical protein
MGGRERGKGGGDEGKRKIYFQSGQFFQLNLGWHGGDPAQVNSPSREFFLKEVFKRPELYI